MAVSVSILGASGFAGAELLRILARHPGMTAVAAAANKQAGKPITDVYPGLGTYSEMSFVTIDEALSVEADLVFSSLPHGQSTPLFGDGTAGKVVDLAGDFRVGAWPYGLTEIHREEISGSERVANPGCYAAAALLALVPLLKEGLLRGGQVGVVGMSGVSGAGRAGGEGFDYASANENLRPYAVTGHKHIAEIEQELAVAAGEPVSVSFVPHLIPMTRGLSVTATFPAGERAHSANEILHDFYQQESFVRALTENELPQTRRLNGTNLAEVSARYDARTQTVIAMCAIDNLGKGAAGQAVQNANLMLGFDETTALDDIGLVP